jgi:hypothetical protein
MNNSNNNNNNNTINSNIDTSRTCQVILLDSRKLDFLIQVNHSKNKIFIFF